MAKDGRAGKYTTVKVNTKQTGTKVAITRDRVPAAPKSQCS